MVDEELTLGNCGSGTQLRAELCLAGIVEMQRGFLAPIFLYLHWVVLPNHRENS
jgi:hypothetical protein